MIYLDNNATTKLDPRVLQAILPFLEDEYGNAASNHRFGIAINKHVKEARLQVAELVGCDENEIVFTSGATEAINLAIKGVVESTKGKGNHIITVATEHPAVLDTCKYLEKQGYEVTYLPVRTDGTLDLQILKKEIKENTVLVSVMIANNETGVIQSIRDIAELAHAQGALFMTDATQAVGKIPILVNELGIDLMSFSAHKFYGPKGIGALFIRGKQVNKVKLEPIIHGGGHERGLRSGTLNVPGIVGFGKAAEIARDEMEGDTDRIGKLRDYLETELLQIENTFLNGNSIDRLYNVSNICFKGIDANIIVSGLNNIAVSNGSACTSSIVEPSHVLKSMGLSDEDGFSSIRFSLGRFNTKEEIDIVIEEIKTLVLKFRPVNIA